MRKDKTGTSQEIKIKLDNKNEINPNNRGPLPLSKPQL